MKVSVPHLFSDGSSREFLTINKEIEGPQNLVAEVCLTTLDLELVETVIRSVLQRRNVDKVMMSWSNLCRLEVFLRSRHRLSFNWLL